MLGATLVFIGVVSASARVIGWMLTAATLAGLLHPSVEALARRIPRALALAAVVLLSIGLAAGVGYAVVDDLAKQLHELQHAVPKAAKELERSNRFGEAAREVHLAERAKTFVDEIPKRLRGGDVQQALRSAATRGVAFLATGVLTIFFLVHGSRLLHAGLAQLPDERQWEVHRIAQSIYRRTWFYVGGSLVLAMMAGVVAYGCADAVGLPGKAPLALWVMLLDLIPLLGVVLGALPMVLLAATTASWQGAAAVAVVLAGWQLIEALVLRPKVEARSLHLGPFVTVAVAMVGLEVYGIGGALVGLVLVTILAATLDEVVGHGPRSSAPRASGGA
jgi:predicted PurR-regulated permease PerM